VGLGVAGGETPAGALTGKALVLDSSVAGGAGSIEAQAAAALGLTVEVKSDAEWAAMTGADFSSYRVVILGDPNCSNTTAPATVAANAATWGPAVNGNVVLVGTDPEVHPPGGTALTNSAIAFAAAAEGQTGMYATLSCYYHGVPAGTPVDMLNGFGTFTVTGVGCFDDSHIVASHPALTGLTDADLSNWSCSVHEAFDSYPAAFTVLAIAEGAAGVQYAAADGTTGVPYILARGLGLSASDISLSPPTSSFATGGTATLTAEVKSGGVAQASVAVTFTAAAGGPNAGATLSCTTGVDGKCSATYVSNSPGTDTWTASFTANGVTQTSNVASVEWTGAAIQAATTTTAAPATTVAPAAAPILPVTGDSNGWLFAVGLGVLFLGGGLLVIVRRPRAS
jgi:LPXTG-motif cell wall-anchored protein